VRKWQGVCFKGNLIKIIAEKERERVSERERERERERGKERETNTERERYIYTSRRTKRKRYLYKLKEKEKGTTRLCPEERCVFRLPVHENLLYLPFPSFEKV